MATLAEKLKQNQQGSVTLAQKLQQKTLEPAQPNYLQRVGEQYQKAGSEIVSNLSRKEQYPGQNILRSVGEVAGTVFSPILEAPVIKPLTEKIVGKALEVPVVNEVVTQANNLAKKYPNIAKDFKSIIDIVTLPAGGVASKEANLIRKDITQGAKILLTPSEEAVQKNVVSLFNKSIKPTAKKTLAQGQKYENDTLNALKTIKANTPNLNILDNTGEIVSGRTPQTIQELSQGLDQTKDLVFKQYDDLAKKAGTQGAVIDAKPIAEEVAKVAQNKALQLTNPDVIKYAEDWSTRLKGFDILDTETTQEVIKLMNNNLQSFYKNPTYDTASKVAVDAGIANNFRQALDKAIEGATGEQYQVLKNQYSALKAIENDVVRASMREARKNTKGLLDYTDILTSGQMVGGILSLNPAMFTKGAIERGFKEYIKFLNDPNRAIRNIFDKLDTGSSATFNPTSATGKFIQNPKMGLSVDNIAKNISSAEKGTLRDFTDLVNGSIKSSDTKYINQLKRDATDIAQKYGFSKFSSGDKALANQIGEYLDSVGFDKKILKK